MEPHDPPLEAEKKILIIEDDPDIRDTMAQILDEEGYRTFTASSGLDALQQLQDGLRPHLILLDLMMPIMDGWQFREEQEKNPAIAAIPVVLISAAGQIGRDVPRITRGTYIRKPISFEVLLSTVEKFCA
jgi:CheY-like chemotaxis protein